MPTSKQEKFKELKRRALEAKKTRAIKFEPKLRQTEVLMTKAEIKALRILNRKPHGVKSLKNTPDNIIDVVGLSKSYVAGRTKFDALKDVSFTIKRGEFVVIFGQSGSGKTTLLNIISGLDRATEGNVIINDVNIAALKNRELTTYRRNNVGFVFQSYNLLPELNAFDNAELGRALQTDNSRRGDIKEIFQLIGMESKLRSPITDLSGGQQQRVAIARTLAKRPHIIFADEPTGSLDSETSELVMNLFKEINVRFKVTVILVTHDKQIARFADKIISVKDGAVKVGT